MRQGPGKFKEGDGEKKMRKGWREVEAWRLSAEAREGQRGEQNEEEEKTERHGGEKGRK